MKVADMRKKTPFELNKHASKLREKLAELQRNQFIKPSNDNSQHRKLRREIAQAQTILTQQTHAKAEEAQDKETE